MKFSERNVDLTVYLDGIHWTYSVYFKEWRGRRDPHYLAYDWVGRLDPHYLAYDWVIPLEAVEDFSTPLPTMKELWPWRVIK